MLRILPCAFFLSAAGQLNTRVSNNVSLCATTFLDILCSSVDDINCGKSSVSKTFITHGKLLCDPQAPRLQVRMVPDDGTTLDFLHSKVNGGAIHWNMTSLEFINSLLSGEITIGEPIQGLSPARFTGPRTPDDVLWAELDLLTALQKDLISYKVHLGTFMINPAVFRWDRVFYVTTTLVDVKPDPGMNNEHDGILLRNLSTDVLIHDFEHPQFIPMMTDVENIRYEIKKREVGFRLQASLDAELGISPFQAQDSRVIFFEKFNTYMLVYTIPIPYHIVRTGISLLFREDEGNGQSRMHFGRSWRLEVEEKSYAEKNWSPFVYNDTILFVRSINPFRVTGLKNPEELIFDTPVNHDRFNCCFSRGDDGVQFMTTSLQTIDFSYSPSVDTIRWNYGTLRGGTPAVRLGDFYLSFFHSSFNLPGSGYKTYFFGAYTFTAEPPFRLLKISPHPIIHRPLYDGPWNTRFPKRKIDYVLFPINFFIEHGTVHLSIGYQDDEGWLLYIALKDLLHSLVDV